MITVFWRIISVHGFMGGTGGTCCKESPGKCILSRILFVTFLSHINDYTRWPVHFFLYHDAMILCRVLISRNSFSYLLTCIVVIGRSYLIRNLVIDWPFSPLVTSYVGRLFLLYPKAWSPLDFYAAFFSDQSGSWISSNHLFERCRGSYIGLPIFLHFNVAVLIFPLM